MNDYSPGGVHVHMMTEEEREADQKRREQERLKYPWRYRGKKSIQEYMCHAHEKKTQYEIHKKKRGRK